MIDEEMMMNREEGSARVRLKMFIKEKFIIK